MTILATILSERGHGGGGIATLELTRKGGQSQKLVISGPQKFVLNYGDHLRAISGTGVVMINPGTRTGMFILTPNLPPNADWKFRTELEINDEATRVIPRGSIQIAEDIGNISRGTGGTTR